MVDGLGNSDILVALGLVGKYVTGPWMRWIPQQSTILELNVLFNEALVRIGDWARDPFPLLGGTVDCAFPGCSIKKDEVYTLLTKRQCDEFENKCCCCCLPTPMALASGGSPMFPLVVHQPASPSIWPAVQSLRRGLSTNPGATMWCVCGCS